MANIINPISVKPRTLKKQIQELSCLPKCQKKELHNANEINERIQVAANVKKQLEADIFERNKKIAKSNEASILI